MFGGLCIKAARLLTHINRFVLSFFPSTILEVVYIDYIGETVTTQYNAISSYFNWSGNYANYLMENTGFYAFTVWNSNLKSKEYYFLSAANVCRAFHLRSLYSFWAYSDHGVVEILNQFMESNRSNINDLFAIIQKNEDLSADKNLQPFMKCFSLSDNATPKSILMYRKWLHAGRVNGEYPIDYEKEKIVIYNYDLDERDVDMNDYLYTTRAT